MTTPTLPTFAKLYQVTDPDFSSLIKSLGVPKGYQILTLTDSSWQATLDIVISEIIRGFTLGAPFPPYVFMKNNHMDFFVSVPVVSNRDVQASIKRNSDYIIANCPYILQAKNPPHTIGKTSWSIIFQNKIKSTGS